MSADGPRQAATGHRHATWAASHAAGRSWLHKAAAKLAIDPEDPERRARMPRAACGGRQLAGRRPDGSRMVPSARPERTTALRRARLTASCGSKGDVKAEEDAPRFGQNKVGHGRPVQCRGMTYGSLCQEETPRNSFLTPRKIKLYRSDGKKQSGRTRLDHLARPDLGHGTRGRTFRGV